MEDRRLGGIGFSDPNVLSESIVEINNVDTLDNDKTDLSNNKRGNCD